MNTMILTNYVLGQFLEIFIWGRICMGIFIQKYGGTSLRDPSNLKDLLTHVKKCISEGNKLVIVVSAMGRKGDPYATDTLIGQLKKINKTIDPKKKDLIMSCGETISASTISHLLDTAGIPSEALMGCQAGILTNSDFNSSEILNIDISKILKYIRNDKVVVVAGFQGCNIDNEITTFGRGGSDITAVTLGGYLNAERVDIFTDVPGLALIDPNIVPYTKYIENISYDDMYLLAENGAKVIHSRAVLAGKAFNIPIKICSNNLEGPGTIISNKESSSENIIGIALKNEDNMTIISVLFKEEDRKKIKNKIEDCLKINTMEILKINYFENKVSIVTNLDKANSYAKDLYDYFFN